MPAVQFIKLISAVRNRTLNIRNFCMKPPIVIEIIPGLDFTTGTGEKSQGSP
jgi:hypothetical protein